MLLGSMRKDGDLDWTLLNNHTYEQYKHECLYEVSPAENQSIFLTDSEIQLLDILYLYLCVRVVVVSQD